MSAVGKLIHCLVLVLAFAWTANAMSLDSLEDRARKLAEEAHVTSKQKYSLTIQNVDIKKFPEVSLIVEAVNDKNEELDSINAADLTVVENGQSHKVLSAKKISIGERVPVDFVIVLDVTATMQAHIIGVRDNIQKFVNNLVKRGIDYRIGLVLFSDNIEKVYQPTGDVFEFLTWMSTVKAMGGYDEPENALEALKISATMDYRPSANRVVLLITDSYYHQAGEKSPYGKTSYTTETMIQFLKQQSVRTFCVVPPVLQQYERIAKETRGTVFDMNQSFSKVLDAYSTQLTNLFAITYRSHQAAIPDSINVAILNENKQELLRKTIPLVEIGRKLIIEDLLFATGSASLADTIPTLEVLTEFLRNQQKVVIRIEGHTDNRGSQSSNRQLSYARAFSVKKYLVDKRSINPRRVQVVGFGDSRPIADNATDFGRKLNRRTEVVIVSK